MDLAPNFVALIEAVVWPFTFIYALYRFKDGINDLLSRVINDSKEIEILGFSAKFSEARARLDKLDLSDSDKSEIQNLLENLAITQFSEMSGLFFSGDYTERRAAAIEVEKIGMEISPDRLIKIAGEGVRGEKVAAAIALKAHLINNPNVEKIDGFHSAIRKGLKSELSRIRFRFVQLVLSSEEITKIYNDMLTEMSSKDSNDAVRTLISQSL